MTREKKGVENCRLRGLPFLRFFYLVLMGLLLLCGCGRSASDSEKKAVEASGGEFEGLIQEKNNAAGRTDREKMGLIYKSSMELQYAEHFSVDYYEGGYKLLKTMDNTEILIVPEGKGEPEALEQGMIVLHQPVRNLYLVSSAVMDIFDKLDALDTIRFSGQRKENWYVENAKKAMENGDILYAGKYDKPDYELIVAEKCSLAIENRMINHSPEVVEMLENFGIPAMIEYSGLEEHPLGRTEWVKFFGALVDKEDAAEKLFEEQVSVLEKISVHEKQKKSSSQKNQKVAFFFITSNGLVQVRQMSDYIPKMIGLAGGRYVPDTGAPESGRSTLSMQMEEFYAGAKDADFLIYNSSIDGGVASVRQLVDKCPVLSDFKAVKKGQVWCTTNDMYQQSMSMGALLEDMHKMLQGGKEEEMKYLFRLK